MANIMLHLLLLLLCNFAESKTRKPENPHPKGLHLRKVSNEPINVGKLVTSGTGTVADPYLGAIEEALKIAKKRGQATFIYVPEGHYYSDFFKIPKNTVLIGNGIMSNIHLPEKLRGLPEWDPLDESTGNSIICNLVVSVGGDSYHATQDRCSNLRVQIAPEEQ
eukprot:m.111767 g.111767  ORF g.111767 m.111767 type:complete len:164 (-) comp14071_c0_seq1:2612-3103(-)